MTAVLHAGIKQGWLSQDLALLTNVLPLVQGGETNGLDLERGKLSIKAIDWGKYKHRWEL